MTTAAKVCLVLASVSGLVSIIAGAYADHGLAGAVAKTWMRTGASFELNHALAVFAAVFVAVHGARRGLAAAWLFLAGALCFSGSLYLAALGAPSAVLMATPVGGLLFIAGWAVLAWACFDLKKPA